MKQRLHIDRHGKLYFLHSDELVNGLGVEYKTHAARVSDINPVTVRGRLCFAIQYDWLTGIASKLMPTRADAYEHEAGEVAARLPQCSAALFADYNKE